jgi:DNA-binding CsgD family transcriptional regulator
MLSDARDSAARMRMRPALSEAMFHLGLLRQNQAPNEAASLISQALSMAEVIRYAPVITAGRAALRPPSERRRSPSTTELSPRERKVLTLTARGHTAAEVAEQLVLSRRTVEKHLEHAYGKIGARNRAEGINWAILNGLTQDP